MDGVNLGKVLGPEFRKTEAASRTDKTGPGGSFADMLKESINDVNKLQHEAEKSMTDLATGKAENVHTTMITMEKAELSFKLMMQVRNKVLDAYREVMRMQV
jgi:flagellar hook-basal body complex protein FliE